MLLTYKNGQTSVILRGKLLDTTSTTGSGLTGLSTSSSGLIIATIADNESSTTSYTVASTTIQGITTLGTFAAPSASSCRFKQVDSTNHPGVYEFQFADARLGVSNAKSLLVSISGATNLVQADFVVQLQTDDPFLAKLTSTTTGLSVNVNSFGGTVVTARDIGSSVLVSSGAGTGQLNITNGTIQADVAKFGGTAVTARDIGSSVLLSSGVGTGQINMSGGTIAHVTLVDTTTNLTNAAPATINSTTMNDMADALLNRDMSVGTDSGSITFRTVRQALRFLRNKWAFTGTTLVVYKEDDASQSWSSQMSQSAGLNPFSSSDPAGP